MTLDVLTILIIEVAAVFLTAFGWVLVQRDKPGFFMVGGGVLSMLCGAEILSAGVTNISDGQICTATCSPALLSAADGTVLLIVVSVMTLIQFGMIIAAR